MFKKILIPAGLLFMFFCLNLQAEEKVDTPESWSFPHIVESARKISPNNIEGRPFNRFGLAYSLEEVGDLDFSAMDADEMQKYADIVTHAYPDAIAEQYPDSCDNMTLDDMNKTSIAGIAYISLNAVKVKNREWAKKYLSVIQNKLKKDKDLRQYTSPESGVLNNRSR